MRAEGRWGRLQTWRKNTEEPFFLHREEGQMCLSAPNTVQIAVD
jgi:hypothetical protein